MVEKAIEDLLYSRFVDLRKAFDWVGYLSILAEKKTIKIDQNHKGCVCKHHNPNTNKIKITEAIKRSFGIREGSWFDKFSPI